MHYLSVCAIARDEGFYIKEWLDHHLAEGVEHFYIYDNQSVDNTLEVLLEYPQVTIIDWPGTMGQIPAYRDCLRRFGESNTWIAFLDIDEFLQARVSNLHSLLRNLEYAPGVAVHWLLFGSNGHEGHCFDPVVKRFTRRAGEINPHVKSIVQPQYCIGPGRDAHTFYYHSGSAVDENGVPLPQEYAVMMNGSCDKLVVNHYHCKSKVEARRRWRLARSDTGTFRDFDTQFPSHDRNEVEDLFLFLKRGYKCSSH